MRYIQHIYLSGPAFDASRLKGMRFAPNLQGYNEAGTRQFQETLRERIAVMPEITSVSLTGGIPFVTTYQMGHVRLLTEGSEVSPDRLQA